MRKAGKAIGIGLLAALALAGAAAAFALGSVDDADRVPTAADRPDDDDDHGGLDRRRADDHDCPLI